MTEEDVWYYKKAEEKIGPVSRKELEKLFSSGEITSETKIWTDSLSDWMAISDVEHFSLSSLDVTPTVPIEKKVEYARETDEEFVKPRPWVRLWSRMIDYSLLFLLVNFFASRFQFPIQPVFVLITLFIWVFIEAILLATWGQTPGKWLMRIGVFDQQEHKLSFRDALNRSFSVWWIGMGVGIPIISFVTMIVAAVKLSNTGATTWDKRSDYSVRHGRIGFWRIFWTILYFICFLIVLQWTQLQFMRMP